jgi:glycosyltransferase involved in cell wall biosynthesis
MIRRIIYLSHWRFPSDKTMTPLILRTCAEYARAGISVELWVPYREGTDPHRIAELPFVIKVLPALDLMRWLGSFGFYVMVATYTFSVLIKLLFTRQKGDVLYGHDFRDFILPVLVGLPIFIEIHDFYLSRFDMVNRLVLRHTTGLIVTNQVKLEVLAKRYGFPRAHMMRKPNAVDFDFFNITATKEESRTLLGLPDNKRLILYTGHLFSWKGVHTLAEAAKDLPEDTFVYFVGGTKEDQAAFAEYVQQHHFPRIVLLPHQEHSKIPLFLRAADVLVLPNTAKEAASKYETSPVKLFEYLASGTPIVASDLPSIRDVVSEQEVFFFEPDNPTSLASTVRQAFTANPAQKNAAQSLARSLGWGARIREIAAFMQSHV